MSCLSRFYMLLVFSHESLTGLGLSRISPGIVKDSLENTRIFPEFLSWLAWLIKKLGFAH